MKRLTSFICSIAIVASVAAQTLNVALDNVIYQFPASQTGAMPYTDGTTLTIMGKEFSVSDIDNMYIDNTAVTDNSVNVVFSQSDVAITVAGNIAKYVSFSNSGAHLSIIQSSEVDDTVGEITYSLSGSTTDGELYMEGAYKCEVDLNGLTLTNATPVYSGAAINIMNGKRVKISVKKSTINTLTDAAGGSQKGALYVKGHPEFKGQGTLNIYGNTAHAIKSGDYMEMKNCTINILSSVKDGISCNEYFLMESGTLNMSNIGDDGIQCDLDGTTNTGDMSLVNSDGSHEDEDSGNIYLQGGTINLTITATAAKGIKAEGDMKISGGSINVETTGNGTYEITDNVIDTKAASCLSADGNMTISGGTINLSSSGSGGKGAKCDGALTISGGDITISTTGGMYFYDGTTEEHNSTKDTDKYDSNYYSSPKGMKAEGNVDITGGSITVSTSGYNGEGIESKAIMTIDGGVITINTYDDALNSSSHMYLKGGYIYANAANNDGIDANGNLYVQDDVVVYAVGKNGEKALDANTEDQYKLYIQGGTMIAISDIENGATMTQTCYQTGSSQGGGPGGQPGSPFGQQSSSSGYSANTWYALYSGGTLVMAFKTPSNGSNIIVSTASTPTMTSGVSVSGGTEYFNGMANIGCNVSGGSSVTLNQYSSQGGGPGGR